MFYSVYIKRRLFGWKKITVKGDTILETAKGTALPVRVFIQPDETRWEVPLTRMIRYSPQRIKVIEEDLRKKGVAR
jgi:hypothetical protein